MKRLLFILALVCASTYGQGQNTARMISGTNVVTACPYTMQATDTTKLLIFNSASACAVTLPAATTANFGAGAIFSVKNQGAGTATITPVSGTINGSSTLVLTTGQGADIYSDGANYQSQQGAGVGGGGGGSPAGNTGDTQCKSSGGTFAACSNNSSIMYVSPSGNDANSGKTWDTAKLTIDAALEALPGGSNTAPLTAGTGTVYFTDGVQFDTNPAHGLWLMGTGDPNYASPPAGWLHSYSSGTLAIIGVGCKNWVSNNRQPQCTINFADFSTNNAILVPNTYGPFLLQNAAVGQHAGKTLWLGTNSNWQRVSSSPVLQTYKNVSFGSDQQGTGLRGPGVDIGNNAFGITFEDSTMQANYSQQSIVAASPSGLVANGTTLTVTLAAANPYFQSGEKCGVLGSSSPVFHFTGTITVVDSTHVTMPMAYTGTGGGGVLICDPGIPVVVAGGAGETAGTILFRNGTWNGGGVKQYGNGNSTVDIEDIYTEGNFTNCASPILWWIAAGGGLGNGAIVKDVYSADQCPSVNTNAMPLIKVEGAISPENIQIFSPNEGGYTEGPMTYHGDTDSNVAYTPLARGEWGVVRGHLEAQTDAARKSPQTTRFANLISGVPTSWYGYINQGAFFTFTTGITDPDAGTNALQISGSTGSPNAFDFFNGAAVGTWNPGDMGACGVWVRVTTGAPDNFQGNPVQSLGCGPAGGTTGTSGCNAQVSHGDGEWDWLFCFWQIATGTQTASNFNIGLIYNTSTIQVADPSFIRIPSGSGISYNEMVRMAYDMRYLSSSCVAGQMCDNLGPVGHFASGNVTGQLLTAQNGTIASFLSPGIPDGNGGSAVTTTPYTIKCDSGTTLLDRASLVPFAAGSSVITVPLSTASGCTGGFVFSAVNQNAGTLTFNRTSPDTFNIYDGSSATTGATSFTLTNGQHVTLSQGASGIWEVRKTPVGVGGGASPVLAWYLGPQCPTTNVGQCFYSPANTQQSNDCNWGTGSGTITCFSSIFPVSGSVTSNVVTYAQTGALNNEPSLITIPPNWAIGDSVTVSQFTGGDTYLNQTCTLTAVTTTSISCALTHANASSTTFGFVQNNGTNRGPFVAGDVGKSVMGWSSCQAFEITTAANGGISATTVPTISSFTNSTQIAISANPSNAVSSTGCFIWGNPDDSYAAAFEAAYDAAPSCPRAMLSASNYMFTQPHFSTQPAACNALGTVYGGPPFITGAGNMFYSAGFDLEGRGNGATQIFLMPNFPNGVSCASLACFVIPLEGRWSNIQLNGGGNMQASSIGSFTNLVYSMVGTLDYVTCINFGGWSGNVAGLDLGWQTQMEQYNNSGCGGYGITTEANQSAQAARFVKVENSIIADLTIKSNSTFTCYDCGFLGSEATTLSTSSSGVSNAGGTLICYHCVSNTTSKSQNQAFSAYLAVVNNGSVLQATDSFFLGGSSNAGNIGIQCQLVTCNNYLRNTQLSGASKTYSDTTGSKLFDQGGNSWGSVSLITLNGQIFNEANSATQGSLVTGNLVLSANWGTGAATSAWQGGAFPNKFTITNGSASTGASPTITYTFPASIPAAPFSCTATQIGGTNATGTFTSSSLSNTGVTFTFSLTPTASSTEIVQVTCVTP